MRTLRKSSFILFALILLISTALYGCGAKQASTAQAPAAQAPTAQAPLPPIKVGVICPLSGPFAPVAGTVKQGVDLAVNEINKAGGILGRQVMVVPKDDLANPETAVKVAQELIQQDKVDFAVTALSTSGLAVSPYFNKSKTLVVAAGSAMDLGDASKYPYQFKLLYSTKDEALVAYDWVIKQLKPKKIGILAENQGAFKELAAFTKESAVKDGIPVEEVFIDATAPSATTQLNKLKAAGVDVIFTWGLNASGARILRDAHAMKWEVPMIGHVTLGYQETISLAGLDTMKNAYNVNLKKLVADDKGKFDEGVVKFLKIYENEFGKPKVELSAVPEVYDGTRMMLLAMQGAKSTDADAVKKYLEANAYSGAWGTFKYSPTSHQGIGQESLTIMLSNSLTISGEYAGLNMKKAPGAP